jgi:hypothetical protein
MNIRVKVASTQAISTALSDINRVRLSAPSIDIKPELSLDELTDVTTVGAKNDNILVYSTASRNFVPSESTALISIGTITGGLF